MREAELKHARVAMLAILGALAQEIGIFYITSSISSKKVLIFQRKY